MALLPFALPFLLGTLPSDRGEIGIRISGFLLVICGVGLVAFSIKEVRKEFGHSGVARRIAEWWKGFALAWHARRDVTLAVDSATIRMVARSPTVHVSTAGLTTAERLDAFDKSIDLIRRQIQDAAETTDALKVEVASKIQGEAAALRAEIAAVGGKLERTAAHGLDYEIVGLMWLLGGDFYTTFPCEIARWMGWVCR
jgi:hypothetical protein